MKDHPYYEEVRYSLEVLNNQGFKPFGVDDGEDEIITDDINKIIEHVLSVDDSSVMVEYKDITIFIQFVLGNEPGVAISNYTVPNSEIDNKLDELTSEIYNHFNQ
jgi:hypothetical protein